MRRRRVSRVDGEGGKGLGVGHDQFGEAGNSDGLLSKRATEGGQALSIVALKNSKGFIFAENTG